MTRRADIVNALRENPTAFAGRLGFPLVERPCRLAGSFNIDVKTRRDPWRIILRPLDENGKPFVPCNIDEIAGIVEIVRIEEVSKHYE